MHIVATMRLPNGAKLRGLLVKNDTMLCMHVVVSIQGRRLQGVQVDRKRISLCDGT